MEVTKHDKVTGFNGHEIYCLKKLGLDAGPLCLGNEVLALGAIQSIAVGFSSMLGGEITKITKLIYDGRKAAYNRMLQEMQSHNSTCLASISFNTIEHPGNFEFTALGSAIHQPDNGAEKLTFSTSVDAQSLYCQMDSGFVPKSFVFGNVAYSIGSKGNMQGSFSQMARGEVKQYTQIFDQTRHLALARIKEEAKAVKANSVIGIETSITNILGTQEMLMVGTASNHPALDEYLNDPVTSDMTNEELWNMVNIGYMPLSLVIGVSIYSLGIASSVMSVIKNFIGGRVDTMTELLYEAREKAFERISQDAEKCGADKVVGVKIRVLDLGEGLIEFMVIGTAVKKIPSITTKTDTLLTQAIIRDKETFR